MQLKITKSRKWLANLLSLYFMIWSINGYAYTFETYGNVGQLAVPIAALLATISHHDLKGTLQLTEAYSLAMGTTFLIKPAINRRRPDGGSWSFPSGHSASAFAGAAFLDRRYGLAYGIPAYFVAATVGYSRVVAKRHYFSDVLGGAAIGIGANLLLTSRFNCMTISPVVTNDQVGIQAHIAW